MELVSIRSGIAIPWVVAVFIAGTVGNVSSFWGWTVLAGVAALAPLVIMWRWNHPRSTISESIQAARR